MSVKEKIKRQEALLDAAKAEGRDLTEDETREFDALQADIDAVRGAAGGTPPPEEGMGEGDGERSMGEAVGAERARIAEIMAMGRHFDMPVDEYVRNGADAAAVREAVIRKLMAETAPVDVSVGKDAADKERAAMVDGLLLRGGVRLESPAPGANEFRAMSLRDLAIDALSATGERGLGRKSGDELFDMLLRQFFNPSAAFPAILDEAINKSYAEGYNKARVTFDQFTSKGSLSDFKLTEGRYLAGPAGEFLEVPEGGELRHDTPVDDKLPGRKLRTFGRQFTMSRQAFINDDIGFLTTLPGRYAASAKKTINKQVFEILFKNPAIYDGVQLFDAQHKNTVSTGSGVTAEAIMAMMLKLQMQKDQFGDAINIRPAILLAPIGYGFEIQTIFTSATVNTPGNTQATNPLYQYHSALRVIEDGTLNVMAGAQAAPWFLFGDLNDAAGIQVDYLNGQETPTIRRMEASGQLGFIWDIYLDWGVTVLDYRGMVKNPGVVLPA